MITVNRYRDRAAAGESLARLVVETLRRPDPVVLALPRGGVPVGRAVARALGVPLDVFVVRKLGLPDAPEYAMGALATGDAQILDESLIASAGVTPEILQATIDRERTELARRERLYRGDRPPPVVADRHVVLVDDGVATGYTMRVAVLALHALRAASLTVAVPVGAADTCALLASTAGQVICPLQPDPFHAVGLWYDHFPAVSDEKVRACLAP